MYLKQKMTRNSNLRIADNYEYRDIQKNTFIICPPNIS